MRVLLIGRYNLIDIPMELERIALNDTGNTSLDKK